MKYIAMSDYVNRDGELIRAADIIELLDDKFTAGLVKNGFIVRATAYDILKERLREAVNTITETLAKIGFMFEDEDNESEAKHDQP